MTQTHRERLKGDPSRHLPIDPYDRHRLEGTHAFSQSMSQSRHAPLERLQDPSFLTREEAEQKIARRLHDAGQTGATRLQLNNPIGEALGQASRTQEQVLTREQAQRIIAQRLIASGQTTVTKSQLEDLINSQMQKSKEKNVDSIQSFAKDSRSYHPSGGVDSKRGTSAVQIRQAHRDVEDQYQRNLESQYDSPPQQRADTEARHKPELSQQMQIAMASQFPQASYMSPGRPQESYAAPHSSPAYFQVKKQSDFKEFKEWQNYLRQREAWERERHANEVIQKSQLHDAGQTGITRSQLNNLIDETLGQASRTQEQVLTREQAQRIVAQRLKDSGQTTATKSQLEDLINSEMQKSKEKNFDRVVNEAIQKSQERPTANQGRPAVQVAPPNRPPPYTNPDPNRIHGYATKGPDYTRHSKAG